MPKKKAPRIGRRLKTHKKTITRKTIEAVYLPMNEIIASNENHSETIQQKHLCRTCLSETSEFHMVFEECIEEMLTTVADVEVRKDDGLPSYICKLCKSRLESAYAFQIQCRRSDHWLRNTKVSKKRSNSNCNLKANKIATCRNNTAFNKAFKKTQLGNNFKITENNEQKITSEMPTYSATNVISSNGDCDVKETEIMFGNTKVSKKDAILTKTELEDIDFKMTENNEQKFTGEMPTYSATNEISSNSDSNIKETEIVGNEQVSNNNVKAINTELESNIGCNQTTEEHDRRLGKAGKQPSKYINIYKGKNGYDCVKLSYDTRVGKHLHCCKCRIDFQYIEPFDAHNEQIHFICRYCSKRFPNRSLLQRHAYNHKEPASFICNICWDTFTSQCLLEIHRKGHPRTFPFKCEICSKAFAYGIHLWKHNQTYHTNIVQI